MRNSYYERQGFYRGKTLASMPENNNFRMEALEQELIAQRNFKASLDVNKSWMRNTKPGSYPYATIAFYRYLIYANAHTDSLQMMKWLILSALTDVRNGVYDQGYMCELANPLMIVGDVNRAFRYIN